MVSIQLLSFFLVISCYTHSEKVNRLLQTATNASTRIPLKRAPFSVPLNVELDTTSLVAIPRNTNLLI